MTLNQADRKILEACVSRERRSLLWFSLFFIATAVVLVFFDLKVSYAPQGPPSPDYRWLHRLFGVSSMFAFLYTMFKWNKLENFENTPLYRSLFLRPEEIIWVYVVNRRFITGNYSYVHLNLSDGDSVIISVDVNKIDDILKAVGENTPNATFGFTPENKARYLERIES